jgi:PTH1 family peptidyl-tRNA hydrolase
VVGLGNPGPSYERTRHNAGFLAVDVLAARHRAAGRLQSDAWIAYTSLAGEPVLLVKPQSYMNRSGGPVARLLAEAGAGVEALVVVVDDVALPLGRLRVRASGSDGGHNGLRSIADALASFDFARVRIGVGAPPPQPSPPQGAGAAAPAPAPAIDLADFVLGEFTAEELPRVREMAALAADAVTSVIGEGAAVAMNRYNGPRG